MIKVLIEMPASAGMAGTQTVELPSVPRIGEAIRDANNRYYKVTAVAYRPWSPADHPIVEVAVEPHYATSPISCINGTEKYGV